MRNPGWAAAALIATALAVTACGPNSYSSGSSGAGGAYGTPTGSSSATAPRPGAAVPAASQTQR